MGALIALNVVVVLLFAILGSCAWAKHFEAMGAYLTILLFGVGASASIVCWILYGIYVVVRHYLLKTW
jgi:hypothetical protein